MMRQDLNSSRFSDENRYKVCRIWNCKIGDMIYAINTQLNSDFKYVQILFIQNPKQTSYLESSCFADTQTYKVC
jgi:hypothetical protein